jgi:DNA invertase Pin-like site-specific DNA recombinase
MLLADCVASEPVNVPVEVTGLPVTLKIPGKDNPTLLTVPAPWADRDVFPAPSVCSVEAQRDAVKAYLNGGNWKIVGEFTEVKSGKREDNRPKLAEAFKACRLHRATLVIAKLDRLRRDAHFLLGLEKAGVDFIAVDNPHLTRFTLTIHAAMAEHEREMISARIRAALAAVKKTGKKLGGRRYKLERNEKNEIVKDAKGNPIRTNEIAKGSPAAIAAAQRAVQERAESRASDIAPTIKALQEAGATSLRAIANGLNEQGIPTARGNGNWSAVQVARVLQRIA